MSNGRYKSVLSVVYVGEWTIAGERDRTCKADSRGRGGLVQKYHLQSYRDYFQVQQKTSFSDKTALDHIRIVA